MTETRWTVDNPGLLPPLADAGGRLEIVVPTADQDVINQVEAAAASNGIQLTRLPAA